MLLQGAYFTAVELAEIAHMLDEQERSVLTGDAARNFRSQNMDDSGYFSIQVMTKALENWNLQMVSFTHPNAVQFRENPEFARAYILNLHEHWFTVRKFGKQWIVLNSVKSGPEMITDTYLGVFFAQLANEGYNVYVVEGDLPRSAADELFESDNPPRMPTPPTAAQPNAQKAFKPFQGTGNVLGKPRDEYDADLAAAIALSLSQNVDGQLQGLEDSSVKRVIEQSLREAQERDDQDRQLYQAMQLSLHEALQSGAGPSSREIPIVQVGGVREIPIVQTGLPFHAIAEQNNASGVAPSQLNHAAHEVRTKRLGFLDRLEQQ
ncbi:peptidase [Aphelenchoides avenae]|nr:peptidase [Aphelenchus avenae]